MDLEANVRWTFLQLTQRASAYREFQKGFEEVWDKWMAVPQPRISLQVYLTEVFSFHWQAKDRLHIFMRLLCWCVFRVGFVLLLVPTVVTLFEVSVYVYDALHTGAFAAPR